MTGSEVQQHPIGLYLKIWILLFVLSTCSYLVDYMEFQGFFRWALILIFMFMKAGLILSVFMHVNWEKPALKLLLFVPLSAIVILIILMSIEADYTFLNRFIYLLKV
ncbi:cytochrome C oxidase subunit IV [Pseudoalteromonas sp. NBT06-2]|uniref:cytochrome C oxidase subunit IV family protein n=1 Tax=Pseudoalteromonas sp. NBT06-2 TaxID=2025950 RepID=UPI000BA5C43A|nr:cytochrome C oxidase subunit IV family protein [Pseudoalteromonas sp. NBT06-2]PAJ73996.1 cytochrome C oxidase subunit IV [Pseudoalteromonas sp. NBT06-2]